MCEYDTATFKCIYTYIKVIQRHENDARDKVQKEY